MRFLLLALIASCLCLPAFAQVYKWVDEKGVTQYGQRPPADTKGQKMNMPDAGPPGTAGAAPATDPLAKLRQQEVEFKQRQAAREAEEARAFKQAAATTQWCVRAKDNLEVRRHARNYDLGTKGERIFKTDAENTAFIAKLEATYKQYCS